MVLQFEKTVAVRYAAAISALLAESNGRYHSAHARARLPMLARSPPPPPPPPQAGQHLMVGPRST